MASYGVHTVHWRDGSLGDSGVPRFGLRQCRPVRHQTRPYAALSHPRFLGPDFSFQSKPLVTLSLSSPLQFNILGVEGDAVRHSVRSARSARPAPFSTARPRADDHDRLAPVALSYHLYQVASAFPAQVQRPLHPPESEHSSHTVRRCRIISWISVN